jgi:hypothetical protein
MTDHLFRQCSPCRRFDRFRSVSGTVTAQGIANGEAGLFMAINALPDTLYSIIWPFMQCGVFITILILVALVMRRVRLAIALGGVGVYFLAHIAKDIVNRGRPAVRNATFWLRQESTNAVWNRSRWPQRAATTPWTRHVSGCVSERWIP